MKLNIDILMATLLVVFVVSFVITLLYGEVWMVNLSTQGSRTPLEIWRVQVAFAAACVGIVTGAAMLYVMATKFGKDATKQVAPSTPSRG